MCSEIVRTQLLCAFRLHEADMRSAAQSQEPPPRDVGPYHHHQLDGPSRWRLAIPMDLADAAAAIHRCINEADEQLEAEAASHDAASVPESGADRPSCAAYARLARLALRFLSMLDLTLSVHAHRPSANVLSQLADRSYLVQLIGYAIRAAADCDGKRAMMLAQLNAALREPLPPRMCASGLEALLATNAAPPPSENTTSLSVPATELRRQLLSELWKHVGGGSDVAMVARGPPASSGGPGDSEQGELDSADAGAAGFESGVCDGVYDDGLHAAMEGQSPVEWLALPVLIDMSGQLASSIDHARRFAVAGDLSWRKDLDALAICYRIIAACAAHAAAAAPSSGGDTMSDGEGGGGNAQAAVELPHGISASMRALWRNGLRLQLSRLPDAHLAAILLEAVQRVESISVCEDTAPSSASASASEPPGAAALPAASAASPALVVELAVRALTAVYPAHLAPLAQHLPPLRPPSAHGRRPAGGALLARVRGVAKWQHAAFCTLVHMVLSAMPADGALLAVRALLLASDELTAGSSAGDTTAAETDGAARPSASHKAAPSASHASVPLLLLSTRPPLLLLLLSHLVSALHRLATLDDTHALRSALDGAERICALAARTLRSLRPLVQAAPTSLGGALCMGCSALCSTIRAFLNSAITCRSQPGSTVPPSALSAVQGVAADLLVVQRNLVHALKEAQQRGDPSKQRSVGPEQEAPRGGIRTGKRKPRRLASAANASAADEPRDEDDADPDDTGGDGESMGFSGGRAGHNLALPRLLQKIEEVEVLCGEMKSTHHVPSPQGADTAAAHAWAAGGSLSAKSELAHIRRWAAEGGDSSIGRRELPRTREREAEEVSSGEESGEDFDAPRSGSGSPRGDDVPMDEERRGGRADGYSDSDSDLDDDMMARVGGMAAAGNGVDETPDATAEGVAPPIIVSFRRGEKRGHVSE